MRGIEHQQTQECPKGHLYLWAPGPGWCPYCDLSREQRVKSMTDGSAKAEPCQCCPSANQGDRTA